MPDEQQKTVYINGRFLGQPVTGVQRYARETLRALDGLLTERAGALRFVILTPNTYIDDSTYNALEVRHVGNLTGHLWEQLELPYFARDGYLLGLTGGGPLLVSQQALVIHDAALWTSMADGYSRAFRWWYRFAHRTLARRGASLFTVSNFSQRELSHNLGVAAETITILAAGCEHILRESEDLTILSQLGLEPNLYFLSVGSLAPHKNLATLYAAHLRLQDALRIPLVVIGSINPHIFVETPIAQTRSVLLTGRVSDGQLRALYSNAAQYVFPSLYEGFGLPAAEAMRCGCPVIASHIEALMETCGESAMYFDVNAHDAIDRLADCMQSAVAEVNEVRLVRIEAGLRHAESLNWKSVARKLLAKLSGDLDR